MNRTMEWLAVPLEVKALNDAGMLEGYASVFSVVDHGGDVILPGAFRKSLAEHAKNRTLPPMFWAHDPTQTPGVWKEMREDVKGLYVKGQLVATPLGAEVRMLLKTKAVSGLSIGFQAVLVDFDRDGHRLLEAMDLWEVSIVSLPMNPTARVDTVKAGIESQF